VNRTPSQEEVLVYLPKGKGRLDLSSISGEMGVEWFDLASGTTADGGRIAGKGKQPITAPWRKEAVALLRRAL
jgi:hypothetical protein